MSESLQPWSAEYAVRAHAVATYLRDASSGGLQPVETYLPRFRGYEAAAREEYERLRAPAREPADAAPWRFPLEIDGYEIVAEVGRGSQGIVYRALDREGSVVAIKVLRRSVAEDQTAFRRFQREVEIARRLTHPALCPVLGSGSTQGCPYLVMRYIAGPRLAEQLAEQRTRRVVFPDWEQWIAHARAAAARLVPIAAALHVAHEAGIVHRDVSPGNIVFDRDGRPFLLDFGLARLLQEDQSRVTETGARLGTPAYAAPELRSGGGANADRRADVFALGAIFMEMAIQRVPTDLDRGRLPVPVVARPAAFLPAAWRDFRAICARATATVPARRYPGAAALADDLDAFARGQRPAARGNLPQRSVEFARTEPALAALTAALLFVLTAATGVSWWLARAASKQADRAELHVARDHVLLAGVHLGMREPAAAANLLKGVPAVLNGFETSYLSGLADSALSRTAGPAGGTVFATAQGPRWCGPEGQGRRLLPDTPTSDDVPPRTGAALLAAGTLAPDGWFRVLAENDTVRAETFRDDALLGTVTLRAPQAALRVWTMTAADTVWCVDADGTVLRLRDQDQAPAPDRRSEWQLLPCGSSVLAAMPSTDTFGLRWRWYRASDATLQLTRQDQDGRPLAITVDHGTGRVLVLRDAVFAADTARLDVIDAETRQLLAQHALPGCTGGQCAMQDPDGVVWAGDGSTLWRIEPGMLARATPCFSPSGAIVTVVPGPGQLILARSADGTLQWWPRSGGGGARLWNPHEFLDRLWFRDAGHVVTASTTTDLLEIDLDQRRVSVGPRIGPHRSLVLTADGTPWWLASDRVQQLRPDGTVRERETPALHGFALPHPNLPYVVAQPRSDSRDPYALELQPLPGTGGTATVLHGLGGALLDVGGDRLGQVLAARSVTGLAIWRLGDPQRPPALLPIPRLMAFALAPDGTQVAAVSWPGSLQVFGTDGSGPRAVQLPARPNSVAWSPDGSRIATGSGDHTVVVWAQADLAPVLYLDRLEFSPTRLAWSSDGQRLVAAAAAGRIQVWETPAVRERVLAAATRPLAAGATPLLTPNEVLVRSATERFTKPQGTIPRASTALVDLASAPLLDGLSYRILVQIADTLLRDQPGDRLACAMRIAAAARAGMESDPALVARLDAILAAPDLDPGIGATCRGARRLLAAARHEATTIQVSGDLEEEFALRAAVPGLDAALAACHTRAAALEADDPLLQDAQLGPALRRLLAQRDQYADATALLAWAVAVSPNRPPEELTAARAWARIGRNANLVNFELVDAALRLRQGDFTGSDVLRRLDDDQLAGATLFQPVACGMRALAEAALGNPSAARFAALRLRTAADGGHGAEDPVLAALVRETAPLLQGR